jgi:tetratricopeptide (TPR) repeat protein
MAFLELTTDQALQKAIEAHKAGRLLDADRLYTAILKVQPNHPHANHNLGILAVVAGKVKKALPFLRKALEANPSIAQFWLSYIDALIKLDKFDEAKAMLDQAKTMGAESAGFNELSKRLCIDASSTRDPPQDELKSLLNFVNQGCLQQALAQSKLLISSFPQSAIALNMHGVLLKRLGQFDKSIDAYKNALSIKPDYVEAFYNMGNALREHGKLEEAIKAYNNALAIKPDHAEAYNNMGNALNKQGKFKEAIKAYKNALAIKPDHADAFFNMGNALNIQGKSIEAIKAYKSALAIKPDHAEAYNNMASALKEQGKLQQAIKAYKKALAIRPDYAHAYNNIGTCLYENRKLEEAIEAYEKAVSIMPEHFEAHNNMGVALLETHRREDAIKAYKKALAINPDHVDAHMNLSLITKYCSEMTQINKVQTLLERNSLKESDRCKLLYVHAKMQEDLGDISAAFESYVAGGNLRRKLLEYDFTQDEHLFGRIKRTAPQLKDVALKVTGEPIRIIPIFILGMPRSGTTLVEQIVSSHTEVVGAGELDFVRQFGAELVFGETNLNVELVSEFRQNYYAELVKLANGHSFVIDKMPQNFRYIALICAAFPEAKIIHVRRNAKATCWSNFKHYFTSKGLGYSYSLTETVKYYGLYNDLMRFWYQSYEDRIFELDYDKLTENQELETRRLIQYLKLKWENECLAPQNNKSFVKTASNQQVRQKIYQGSSKSWQKYETFLEGIFDKLDA